MIWPKIKKIFLLILLLLVSFSLNVVRSVIGLGKTHKAQACWDLCPSVTAAASSCSSGGGCTEGAAASSCSGACSGSCAGY